MKRVAWICSILLAVAILGCGGGGSSNPVRPVTAPQITSIYPQSGGPGTEVMIRGSYFGAAQASSYISYNGDPCVFSFWSDTYITCTIPSTARSSGSFVVTAAGVVSAPSMQFVLNGPQIFGISPSSGPAGSLITISGNGFGVQTSNSRLSFNYDKYIYPESWSNNAITCRVPEGILTNGSIVVCVYLDSSYYVTSSFNHIIPTISDVSPSTGHNIGAELIVTGQGFGSSQNEYNGNLTFGSVQVPITYWSNTRIVFRIPSVSASDYHAITFSINGKTTSSKTWPVKVPFLNSMPDTTYESGAEIALTGSYFGLTQSESGGTNNANSYIYISNADGTDGRKIPATFWSDSSIKFTNPFAPVFGTDTKSVYVVVGGLQSNAVNVKVQ